MGYRMFGITDLERKSGNARQRCTRWLIHRRGRLACQVESRRAVDREQPPRTSIRILNFLASGEARRISQRTWICFPAECACILARHFPSYGDQVIAPTPRITVVYFFPQPGGSLFAYWRIHLRNYVARIELVNCTEEIPRIGDC